MWWKILTFSLSNCQTHNTVLFMTATMWWPPCCLYRLKHLRPTSEPQFLLASEEWPWITPYLLFFPIQRVKHTTAAYLKLYKSVKIRSQFNFFVFFLNLFKSIFLNKLLLLSIEGNGTKKSVSLSFFSRRLKINSEGSLLIFNMCLFESVLLFFCPFLFLLPGIKSDYLSRSEWYCLWIIIIAVALLICKMIDRLHPWSPFSPLLFCHQVFDHLTSLVFSFWGWSSLSLFLASEVDLQVALAPDMLVSKCGLSRG